jgi:hypothetical protein
MSLMLGTQKPAMSGLVRVLLFSYATLGYHSRLVFSGIGGSPGVFARSPWIRRFGRVTSPVHALEAVDAGCHPAADVHSLDMVRGEAARFLPEVRVHLAVLELPQERATAAGTRQTGLTQVF